LQSKEEEKLFDLTAKGRQKWFYQNAVIKDRLLFYLELCVGWQM
jgi:hypothetical protein